MRQVNLRRLAGWQRRRMALMMIVMVALMLSTGGHFGMGGGMTQTHSPAEPAQWIERPADTPTQPPQSPR